MNPDTAIPKDKQTTLGLYLSAKEAYSKMEGRAH